MIGGSRNPKFDSLKRYKLPERALSHTSCKLMQQLWETVRRFLKKLKIELPSDSTISLLGIYERKQKLLARKNIYTSLFIVALFTIAKIWK